MNRSGPIRVLIIDDSALMRKLLTGILRRSPDLEVVGTAVDPFDAREKIKALSPDVLTLDVEMPRMDGLTFLRNLMRLRPMPVLMISSLTERGAETSLAALELGAIDYVTKPKLDLAEGLESLAEVIIQKVRLAAGARVGAATRPERSPADPVAKDRALLARLGTTDQIIALGASTGGTEAVAEVLSRFPPDAPGTVIAQHIPEVFSTRWAERLDRGSAIVVKEASDGDQVLVGHAYVAPGNFHLRIERSGARYLCRITQDAPVNRHRPSVDALFRSVAEEAGRNAVGVILTGMGADGAEGLLAMARAGAPTLAQDRETSVVWGMPGEAVKRGAAAEVLPLERIADRALALARRTR